MSNKDLKKTKTGHTIEEVSEGDFLRISKDYPMYDGLLRLHPGGWFLQSTTPQILDKIYDFNFKESDTIVLTCAKSGTTWMQEIVWTLQHNPDLQNPMAKLSTDLRCPHIELDAILLPKKVPKFGPDHELIQYLKKIAPDRVDEDAKVLLYLEHVANPRVIKSHLPLDLFPPKMLETSKVIYMTRDPRDVVVSKYHFFKILVPHSYSGTLDDFINYMINEEQLNQPYWKHIKMAYDLRDHKNLLFLYFEDLKKNPYDVITQISEFLGLNRTPKQIQNVVDYTDFVNMKKRVNEGKAEEPMSDGGRMYKNDQNSGASFYRKGKSGSWKDSYTPEQIEKISTWMNENLKIFPPEFKYKSDCQ